MRHINQKRSIPQSNRTKYQELIYQFLNKVCEQQNIDPSKFKDVRDYLRKIPTDCYIDGETLRLYEIAEDVLLEHELITDLPEQLEVQMEPTEELDPDFPEKDVYADKVSLEQWSSLAKNRRAGS